MKSIISKYLAALMLSFLVTGTLFSQGLYSKKTTDTDRGGIILRDIDENNDTPGGNVIDPGINDVDSPVGEGFLILSLLAGGYAVIKKSKYKKKNED
ncbi:MAG: hypothetical protein LBR64_10425 [Dysgonamonadaceae bacterium]|jgi:hypothetical protein|nr:hypothetical protein [Dysgonamonadaceae bacterium]